MAKHAENRIDVVNVRLVKEPALYSAEPIKTPEDVLRVVADELKSYDREVFAIINLKSNGQIINLNVCSIGTLNASLVSPREIMKAAILSNASAFIAVHNHLSGNCSPSSEDIETTKRLAECGEILDIRMLDHIIVAGETGKMLSMKAEGSMPDIRKKDWER
ncbi:MAG: JAB domain-containing protein [Eubacteriales bacterium]|nr:JAB domain-containing protein [Eubacteriales bacterium]